MYGFHKDVFISWDIRYSILGCYAAFHFQRLDAMSYDGAGKVILRYYPNQRNLHFRNQIVEHPYGTVKRWNDGYYLLVKGRGRAKASLESCPFGV